MRSRMLLVLSTMLLLVAAPPLYAEDNLVEPEDERAAEILDTYASDGAAGMAPFVTPEALKAVNPTRVAARMLLAHARAALAGPPLKSHALKAAAAFAAAAKSHPEGAELPGLVARWTRLDEAALEDVIALRDAYVVVRTALNKNDWTPVESTVDAVRPAIDRALWSPTAIDLAALGIVVIVRSGHERSAGAANRVLAERCLEMGWTRSAAALFSRSGASYANTGDLERAYEDFGRARSMYLELERPANAARVRVTESTLDRRRGALDLAEEKLREALALFDAADDKDGAARSFSGLGNLQQAQGRFADALASHTKALTLNEEIDSAEGIVVAHINIGVAHDARGEYAKAREHQELALEIATKEQTHPAHQLDRVRTNLAGLYARAGEHKRARKIYRDVVLNQGRTEAKMLLPDALSGLGMSLTRVGRFAEALDALERALKIRRQRGDLQGEFMTLSLLATTLTHVGRYDHALEAAEARLAIAERLNVDLFIGKALNDLGSVYAWAGRNQEALDLHRRSLEIAKRVGDAILMQHLIHNLGSVLTNADHLDEALPLLEEGLEAARALGHKMALVASLKNFGIFHLKRRNYAAATGFFTEAREIAERLGNRVETAETLRLMSTVLFRQENYEQGVRAARRAVELRLEIARGLGAGEATAAGSATLLAADFGLDCAMVLIDKEGATLPRLQEAFWLSEAGRSLGLLEGMVNRDTLIGAGFDPELRQAEAEARDEVRILHGRLVAEAQAETPSRKRLRASRKKLDRAYGKLEKAISSVDRAARRNNKLVDPRPATTEAIQAALPEDTTLLRYVVMLDGQAVVFVITADAIEFVRLGNSGPVEARAAEWRRLVRTPGTDDREAASALANLVLDPIEEHLENVTRIVVAPDGGLALVPFEALIRGEGDRAHRLIETHEVVYAPSASVFAALEQTEGGRGLLALGDPVYPGESSGEAPPALALRGLDLGRIPATGDEAREIARLFGDEPKTLLLREDATREALEAALEGASGRFAAVHLACHGLVDTQRPMLTGLVLSHGRILSLSDVYRLHVPADLVVLSACKTGLGKLTDSEGVLGLARGFFFAGAPRVVVSNWRVSDESTRDLMIDFYRSMREGGLSSAAALRKAKLAQLEKPKKMHPYHWAGFVLWGRSD